ncbi:hypothetical protein [Brevibacillus agri]|nr:hypothetical protein [Brevibacillus agri]MED3497973.1 hypothetical protein [Brevibacillus agri]
MMIMYAIINSDFFNRFVIKKSSKSNPAKMVQAAMPAKNKKEKCKEYQ